VLADTDMDLATFADSIGVTPRWLARVLAGEITELPLLTVVGICRRLRLMPEDIWEPGLAASAFATWPGRAFFNDEDRS